VRARLVEEQASALALKEGQARLAALRQAPTENLPTALTVSRNQSQGLPRQVMDAVLRADATKLPAVTGVEVPGQGFVVLRVTQVLAREAAPGGDDMLRNQYAQAWAAAEGEAYLAALKQRYKVEVKPAAFEAVEPAAPL
jgi:peptidyl-prolyl cis-trans isomerase D